MNIKSLILGSAAAIVAAGAAQAADLPVAEPVDYVKVCDAYGAGYFFIPGTDTCLKINGEVAFFVGSHGFGGEDEIGNVKREEDLLDMYVETNITFTARQETEYGTLSAVLEMDDADNGDEDGSVLGGGTAFDKAWLSLNGFYAGVTDSIIDFNAGTTGFDDFAFGQGDVVAIGYAMPVGNGVTITVAAEDYAGNANANINGAAPAAGISMPSFAATVGVDQAWGSIVVGGSVFQVRYPNAAFDTDLGYSVGGKATVDIAEGLSVGVAGGYSRGSNMYLPKFTTALSAPSAFDGTLMANWTVSAGLEYSFADNVTFALDGGYEKWIDKTVTNFDTSHWGVAAQIDYEVVDNLNVIGLVGYQKTDYSSASGVKDWDDVRARLKIIRTF
ncbi:Porin subfamily protein [Cohaesibacter sp. ES.047]|uniref:porin n=1 Tax=Cohaesibacter sp. ES.047 TaxID=1798205 RepID=UPI000BBF9260|nr:porin [Cohaesibacter sp. ES.047]SNY92427.1 Porin subfamily protein [Cohaesibacter sp. ES.047]